MPKFKETHQILLYATTVRDSLLLLSTSQRQGMLRQIHPSTPMMLLQQDKSDSLSQVPKATRICCTSSSSTVLSRSTQRV